MTDRRRARRAKQSRRDGRRATKRTEEISADWTLKGALRRVLHGHPLELLSIACVMVHVAKPDSLTSPAHDVNCLDRILPALIGSSDRETTALLAVVAELLVDEPEWRSRCQVEVAERDENLPRWIEALTGVEVYRAVRRTHVFGDVDELVVGLRLDGGYELTIAVQIDHNMCSSVVGGAACTEPIDEALAHVAERSSDTSVFEMTLPDARAWIEHALNKPTLVPEDETWPLYRPLVRWLVGRLPEGGERRPPASDPESSEELCDAFFATSAAAPFTESGHRDLLLQLFESGAGDPLRWSAARVELAISVVRYFEKSLPLEVLLDAPDLLRAFIPFAHAQSGIRDALTSKSIRAIDALRSTYRRGVLSKADSWPLDDAV